MSGANASPTGRSHNHMSGANASPTGRSNNEMTGYRNIKDTPREEFIAAGTTACGGCGGLEVIRLASKVLGGRVVFVNAAGCFSLLALYPFTPFRGSWLYTTMGSAPAGAQGIRDALDILQTKGKLSKADDLQVVVLAGDGSTYDIALSATSGTLFRNLDYWYICYDNQAYGNTGTHDNCRCEQVECRLDNEISDNP
jgi:pyruvate ferredoxin oxidoreductase beta subunit